MNTIQKNKSSTLRLSRIYMYLLYFFIFAFLGWLLETFYSLCVLGHFTKRGFLFGPICPIYGCGGLILIIFLGKYKNNALKLFFFSAIIFSIFEYIVSFILDALFSLKWWDYSTEFLNLNGRISILYSVAWGIIALVFLHHIYPFFKKKINIILSKIPVYLQYIILQIAVIILFLDTIISSVYYIC